MIDVTQLSWSELNTALQDCGEMAVLQEWLTEMMRTGRLTRALRVYGRMSVVRREIEIAAIKSTVAAAREG